MIMSRNIKGGFLTLSSVVGIVPEPSVSAGVTPWLQYSYYILPHKPAS